jgi:hypothetical protein
MNRWPGAPKNGISQGPPRRYRPDRLGTAGASACLRNHERNNYVLVMKPLLPLVSLALVVTGATGRAEVAESSHRPPASINACFTGKLAAGLNQPSAKNNTLPLAA